MNYKILQSEVNEGIAIITISRPQALNALNSLFFDELDALLDELNTPLVKAVVITGEGKSFVAGADIAEMAQMNAEQGEAFSRKGQQVFNKMERFPVPVIAAINGFALGGGCELAAACDIRLASEKAKFGQPEVNLGLIPGYSGTQRLPRLLGKGSANYLLMSGEMITANEALQINFVQKVYPPDELLPQAKKLAITIASKGAEAVKRLKKTVMQGMELPFLEAEDVEAKNFGSCFGTPETTEGINAFLNKRKPNW